MLVSRMVIATLATAIAVGSAAAQTAPWETVTLQQGSQPFALQRQEESQSPLQNASVSPFSLGDSADPLGQATGGTATGSPAQVDETALRYYASNGEIGRVSAEINRLKSLHPNWEPPEDIFDANRTVVDEQPLWELFNADKTQELYVKIREYIKVNPGYAPSSELKRQIYHAEARRAIVRASNVENHREVIKIASENPDLLVCTEIDMIWRVAEALLRSGNDAKALQAYQYILSSCGNEQERVATVQKAAALLPRQATEQLISLGRTRLDGRSEFDDIYLDILRGEIGKGASDEMILVKNEDLTAMIRSVQATQNPDDAELLGWYYYVRQEYKTAENWFRMAMKVRPSAKAIEGIVVAKKEDGNLQDAEDFAYKHRRKDPLILKAYLEVVSLQLLDELGVPIEFKRLSRFVNAIEDAQSANAAQVLGWHFLEMEEIREATIWFEKSMEYQPNESAVLGLVVIAQRQKQRGKQNQLIAKWSKKFPDLETMRHIHKVSASRSVPKRKSSTRASSPVPKAAKRQFDQGNYEETLALLGNSSTSSEARRTKLMRAWSLLHSGRPKEANRIFAEADSQSSTRETRQGRWFSEKAMYNYK
ncbi:hypothetical protein [Roseibium sp. MMSF_3544]|uniref:hypothetical protein n=1 Tax=unclassified Roseibium TaxID=2629323 RepID=UPI00273F3E41|nr:hypothetical protein [Roseibium sp. MMSF_3544]